jgi:hypothetical protein
MNPLETYFLRCPWCGKPQDIAVDLTVGSQQYVEDCWTCCRPMLIRIEIEPSTSENVRVSAEPEGM